MSSFGALNAKLQSVKHVAFLLFFCFLGGGGEGHPVDRKHKGMPLFSVCPLLTLTLRHLHFSKLETDMYMIRKKFDFSEVCVTSCLWLVLCG